MRTIGRALAGAVVTAVALLGLVSGAEPAAAQEKPPLLWDTAVEEDATDAEADDEPRLPSPWLRVPELMIFPRLGGFLLAPRDAGYYSLYDLLLGRRRPSPPLFPYPAFSLKAFPFYDADFRYLERPDNTQLDIFDPLKRIHLFDNWLLSSGGEFRYRYMNEVDSRLTGSNNEYNLYREIFYLDLCFRDQFRLFAEFLSGESAGHELPPLAIDENPADMVDLFIDWKLFELGGKNAYLRVGRFEMLLGSERLISPLEWVNTLRNFQGLWAFRQGERIDVHAFLVQPIRIDADAFDWIDPDQTFAGLWGTHRPKPGTSADLYLLNRTFDRPDFLGRDGVRGGFDINTLGIRWVGDYDRRWLWDFEGMFQFGRWVNQRMLAGAATASVGYRFAEVPTVPQFWLAWDWASGDPNPGQGATFSTFNQLFPFGHYYLGYLDLVGRQNIRDLNGQIAFYPTRWITCLAQVHCFWLDQPRSPLFNAGGVPIRRDPTGRAGRDVGREIDLLANIHLDAHQDILIGWSKLFAGRFIKETGDPGSPELFYVQYQFRW
ncbi:MAG: alginate export family protein [Gemmataceae bacterium]|nr:alginate export family protein [Gemmataceae bacterium]MDW8266939.1 alginate export family protein [Gemmataceae bacterium]